MAENNSSIAAADFVRHFPKFRSISEQNPVVISSYGKPTHVLMSVQLYEQIGTVRDTGLSTVEDRHVRMLAEWIDEGMIICDDRLNVCLINRTAQAMVGKSADEIEKRSLRAALPEIKGTLLENYATRSAASRTPNSAELPSPFSEGSWISFQTFPLGDYIVFKLRDITDDMQAHRLASVKEALIRAFELNGHVSYVRLSARGTIERLDDQFSAMIGLPGERLSGLSLAELIDLPERVEFRAKLERVLRDQVALSTTAGFLTNAGEILQMSMAMVPLVGSYGCEGVVTILTRDRSANH